MLPTDRLQKLGAFASPKLRIAALLIIVLIVTGCAQRHYIRTAEGKLTGKLIVEWRKPNLFIYRPDVDDPLRFFRADGREIRPERIWTDGGSIPRPFWIFKNFSPWGYGPAFVVHDWLFVMQDCMLEGHEDFTLKEAAIVMSEVMKTLMENPDFDYGSVQSMYAMYKAVQTAPAEAAWNDRNCEPVPSLFLLSAEPDASFILSFD